MPRLGRRRVLRAGAGAAAGLLIAGGLRPTRAAPWRQAGSFTIGGRWSEADGLALMQGADPAQYVSFATDFPFYALAPSWSGEGDPGGSVELLWSGDGVTWSEPLWIGRSWHGGAPDRDGRHIGSLVATPGGAFIQYRTYDGAGNLAKLPGFEIDYIDATAGPTLEQVANPATTPSFSPPPVIARAAWGADESLRFGRGGKEIFPVAYQPVEHAIIHHADTANFNDPVLEMRSIYYFHAVTRGWGDIAYNYLVDFMGNVYEGRVGGETAIGCHAEGYNAGSCGICLMGRFFEDDITPEMHNAVVWIASWAARELEPNGSAPFHDIRSLPTICGHRDVNNTTCPGDEFYVQLEEIRLEARRVINGRDDPEPPPAQWHSGMRVITNADGSSLREGPGLDFAVVATVALGERLTVLQGPATNDDMIWYEVEGVSLAGWIAGKLLDADPDAPVPALEPAETPEPAPAGGETAPDATPGAEPPVDEAAVGGDQGGVTKEQALEQATWPVFAPGTATMVINGPLNLRVEPGLWADILTALPDGYAATVVAGPVASDGIAWYQIVTPEGLSAWCDGSFLQPV
jgi:uncharacterized protein YgiM (DUF1202 family)